MGVLILSILIILLICTIGVLLKILRSDSSAPPDDPGDKRGPFHENPPLPPKDPPEDNPGEHEIVKIYQANTRTKGWICRHCETRNPDTEITCCVCRSYKG